MAKATAGLGKGQSARETEKDGTKEQQRQIQGQQAWHTYTKGETPCVSRVTWRFLAQIKMVQTNNRCTYLQNQHTKMISTHCPDKMWTSVKDLCAESSRCCLLPSAEK